VAALDLNDAKTVTKTVIALLADIKGSTELAPDPLTIAISGGEYDVRKRWWEADPLPS